VTGKPWLNMCYVQVNKVILFKEMLS